MKKHAVLVLFLMSMTLLSVGCVKTTTWQGKYVTLETTKLPKEDYKIGDYIVVAYDVQANNKKSEVIYRFDIMQADTIVRAFEFGKFKYYLAFFDPLFLGGGMWIGSEKKPDYCLTELAKSCINKPKSDITYYSHCRSYKTLPTYDKVKADMQAYIAGQRTFPEE